MIVLLLDIVGSLVVAIVSVVDCPFSNTVGCLVDAIISIVDCLLDVIVSVIDFPF